jgi:hypothetical protein
LTDYFRMALRGTDSVPNVLRELYPRRLAAGVHVV